ncbi:unnamed protein product [Trichobilharzia szidati]|nr:unnamed protein product [Trichobilharzia szidati]
MAVVAHKELSPTRFIDGIDVNSEDYIRELLRPPDIKEDVKLMQERSRVSLILRSAYFRKELEKIVASSLKSGCLNANVIALKQIIDYLTPQTRLGSSAFTRGATVPVVPINDLRTVQLGSYVKGERLTRCKLASVYRLVDIFGWNTGINNHITARIARDTDEYLINPIGLLYNEVTASSLVKINLEGSVLVESCVNLGIDKQSWMLHAAVHSARPDVRCIIHLSTPAAVAVSCTNAGLLPISQEAMILGETAVYDPLVTMTNIQQNGEEGVDSRKHRQFKAQEAEIARIFSEKSTNCMVLLVRSYGLLAMGQSIEEAWFTAYTSMLACEAQLRLASISLDELVMPTKEAQEAAHSIGRTPSAVQLRAGEVTGSSGWRRGELEFEALMRRLDAAGYRTGYVYRLSQIRQGSTVVSTLQRQPGDFVDSTVQQSVMSPRDAAAHVRRAASLGRGLRGLKDVEIPPTVSSFATSYYGDEESRAAAAAEMKAKTLSLSRAHWLSTPNAYLREEIEEIGTPNPKKITHWTEGTDDNKNRTGGVSMPLVDPNQFALQGSDPQEFKNQQRKVKDKYYKDVRSAGPKSRILQGIDIDDEGDETDGTVSPKMVSPKGTLLRLDPSNPPSLEPGHVVVVGAASKGIIHRNQRHNAGVYQSVYSPNPFDRMTDEDLERYKENIERKAKGLPSLEEEEARARIEEARHAAEVAREAMEAASRMTAGQKLNGLHLGSCCKYRAPTVTADYNSTLADLSTSVFCSSTTSCLTDNNDKPFMMNSYPENMFNNGNVNSSEYFCSLNSSSLETLSSSVLPLSSATGVSDAFLSNTRSKSCLRRRSARRFWHWPHRITTKSGNYSLIKPIQSLDVVDSGINKVELGYSKFFQRFTAPLLEGNSNNTSFDTRSPSRLFSPTVFEKSWNFISSEGIDNTSASLKTITHPEMCTSNFVEVFIFVFVGTR